MNIFIRLIYKGPLVILELYVHLAPAEVPGCKSDDECPLTDTCLNRQCVNPCAATNPCASNAVCQATNHKAVCRCPDGFIGNAFVNCYKGNLPAKINTYYGTYFQIYFMLVTNKMVSNKKYIFHYQFQL